MVSLSLGLCLYTTLGYSILVRRDTCMGYMCVMRHFVKLYFLMALMPADWLGLKLLRLQRC